jgi:taurine dioxygenase
MSYRFIEIVRRAGPVGAEVAGVDLAVPLTAEVRDEIRAAWLTHHVLFFRDQSLTPAQQADFAANFGELDVYPFMKATSEHPHVIPIIKEADANTNFGGGWHTDTSYLPQPPMATVLYAVEVPDEGGDTLFADASAAYDDLSPGMKKMLDGLTGIYSARIVHGRNGAYTQQQTKADLGVAYGGDDDVAEREVEHPLIRTHPETGRKSIYCSAAHTWSIKDMARAESLPILQYLTQHLTQSRYVTRFHWTPGTLAMWDNRCLFHHALNDYHGQRRHMQRVIIRGDRPY